MNTIELDESRLPEILAKIPSDRPVTMLNMLKYNELATYPEGADAGSCSGRIAYSQRYFQHANKKIEAVGGTVLYSGEVCAAIIGPSVEYWDSIVLVTYPSITTFFEMVSTPEYQALRIHRAAALEDSRLIATIEKGL